MEKSKFIDIVTKYYKLICNITYLCIEDVELTEDITKKIFAKLYHNNIQYNEEIKYQNWLIKNTLKIINNIKKCQGKKESLITDYQFAFLYMESYLKKPFNEILSIFERNDGNASKQLGKAKKILFNKGITNIEEYISDKLVNVPAMDDDKEKLTQEIVKKTDTESWENSIRKNNMHRNVKCYFIKPAIIITALLFLGYVGVSIAAYVKYSNWNVFEVMNYGDPGEKFEINQVAEDDGRSYTTGKMNVTLEKSWYSEKWRIGYCYFVIKCEGRNMRLEDIDIEQIESEILFGPDNNYSLKLKNYEFCAHIYAIEYYITEDTLHLAFKITTDVVKNGEKFAISFEDKKSMKEVGVFEFGEVSND